MNNGCEKQCGAPKAALAHGVRARRFPDFRNLPKPRWRDALRGLAGPAVRVHRFRSLRTAMLHDALSSDPECGSS